MLTEFFIQLTTSRYRSDVFSLKKKLSIEGMELLAALHFLAQLLSGSHITMDLSQLQLLWKALIEKQQGPLLKWFSCFLPLDTTSPLLLQLISTIIPSELQDIGFIAFQKLFFRQHALLKQKEPERKIKTWNENASVRHLWQIFLQGRNSVLEKASHMLILLYQNNRMDEFLETIFKHLVQKENVKETTFCILELLKHALLSVQEVPFRSHEIMTSSTLWTVTVRFVTSTNIQDMDQDILEIGPSREKDVIEFTEGIHSHEYIYTLKKRIEGHSSNKCIVFSLTEDDSIPISEHLSLHAAGLSDHATIYARVITKEEEECPNYTLEDIQALPHTLLARNATYFNTLFELLDEKKKKQ